MRKIVLGLVAATAVAAPIAMAASSANAATTDVNGVVTVTKGEIMAQFPGMNEAAFQNGPKVLTGSDVSTFTTETVWGCTDGSLQHHFRNTIRTTQINFAPITNANASKVTGWTMTKGASTFTENNTDGTRFPNFACPAGTGVDFSRYSVLTPTVSQAVTSTFNGTPVSIVVNPYVAPAPALVG
jgi:hypothetical protein